MRFRPIVTTVLLGALLVTASACSAQPPAAPSGGSVFPDEAVSDAIAELPQESVAPMPTTRLAEGLIPPTNRWFSGLVFGDALQPVFPLPLAFSLTGAGFDFGVPVVQSGADTIAAGPSAEVSAAFPTAVTPTVVAYDDASVTIELTDAAGTALGTVIVAEGSPLVTFTAETDTMITLTTPPAPASENGVFRTTVADREYGMVGDATVDGSRLSLKSGETVTWFAVPEGSTADELAASAAPVTGVSAASALSDGEASTSLTYATENSDDTLLAVLPHQYESLTTPEADACDLGTYESVYGTMHLCAGGELSWTAPTVEPTGALALDAVSDSAREEIRAQLAKDVETPAELPDDTYFGGKALYRLANLLQLATALSEDDAAETVRTRLVDALTDWTTADRCETESTRCFVYDPDVKGMVGKVASFGSDEFNDHHFHYGYLLYAAAIAVQDDPSLQKPLQPVMDLVAADLATDGGSSFFPDQRAFDAYAGHSWASGYVPFRDGNNQESSSEAVTAWNGLALWAEVTGNDALADEARWMLASEAATAQAYWVGFDQDQSVYEGYDHSIVALNWGSKRDYSTWFSAEPAAKLGIQLIPMSPASAYLAGDAERITENLDEGAAQGYGVQFGDYMLMYAALRGPDAAADALAQAEDDRALPIDDANSRTYLLAFLASQAAR
jgi:endo-1,3(4)-beta-glucanase